VLEQAQVQTLEQAEALGQRVAQALRAGGAQAAGG
jgi:hydroxymethylbilane synthase